MTADADHWMRILERFEGEAWRCAVPYAERVRRRVLERFVEAGGEAPLVVALEELMEAPPEASGEEGRPRLVVSEGTFDERVVALVEGLTVGRGPQNDLKLSGDNKISRYHCRVWWAAGRWWLEDLASANGTLVNGEALAPHVHRPLYGGEELIVGGTFVRFYAR